MKTHKELIDEWRKRAEDHSQTGRWLARADQWLAAETNFSLAMAYRICANELEAAEQAANEPRQ